MSNKLDLSLIITVLLFLIGYWVNSWLEDRKRRETRRSYLRALSEEIKLNVQSLERADRGMPSMFSINKFLAVNQDNRPYLTFSFISVIYMNRTEVLQDMPDILVRHIVKFYGMLNDIALDVAAVDKDAFVRISRKSREEVILDIIRDFKLVLQQGNSLVDAIELQLRPRKRLF